MIKYFCDKCKKEKLVFEGVVRKPNFLPSISFELCADCLLEFYKGMSDDKKNIAENYIKILTKNV